jgi:hypothetical protein
MMPLVVQAHELVGTKREGRRNTFLSSQPENRGYDKRRPGGGRDRPFAETP